VPAVTTATVSAPPFAPSSNVAQLKESATIAVSARARALKAAGRQVIDLGAGEPDFDTPEFIRRAAQRSVDAGATRYTATEGILPLREAIAAQANALYRGADPVKAADVVVSTGSKQSLFNACFVLFGAGDEVLVPTPSWTSYYEMVALAKAVPVPVFGARSRGLKVTAAELADAATPRTRGVMLNSPCNPTGAVYSAEELREILALAAERGWWVISDEIYLQIAYDAPATSALSLVPDRERLILINGVAKSYAMTGWRIGWAIAPRAVSAAMTAFQSHTTSNAAAVSQHAAVAALTDTAAADAAVTEMVRQFKKRRDAAMEVLDAAGVQYVRPEGAFYLYIDVGGDGNAFATRLLDTGGIAVVPGSAFLTPEWVRASYAAPIEHVVEGMRRLVAAL
jgi:aspartate aminotransferase